MMPLSKSHNRFWIVPLLLGAALVLIAVVLFPRSPAPATPTAPSQQKDPQLTVTVSPESPTTYEKTSVTIHITNVKALRDTPTIVDETRGIERIMLRLYHLDVDEWRETYALPILFPKDDLPLDNEITLRVTIKDLKGHETAVTRVITFESEDALRTVQ